MYIYVYIYIHMYIYIYIYIYTGLKINIIYPSVLRLMQCRQVFEMDLPN